jgi:hypothetical protein
MLAPIITPLETPEEVRTVDVALDRALGVGRVIDDVDVTPLDLLPDELSFEGGDVDV